MRLSTRWKVIIK